MKPTPSAEKIIIYCRVSTDKQRHDSQLSELREYCLRRGWQEVEEITDIVSSVKSSREGPDPLMSAVRRGKVDASFVLSWIAWVVASPTLPASSTN